MSSHEHKALKTLIPALDDDVDEMSDEQVSQELLESGVDLAKSAAAFRAFAPKALAAFRRKELEAAERTLAARPATRDLFQKAKQLTLAFTDDMIRALIVEKGGFVPAHRQRDGRDERELLIQTLADVMILRGEE